MAPRQTRREWLAAATATLGAFAGCSGNDSGETETATSTRTTASTKRDFSAKTPGQGAGDESAEDGGGGESTPGPDDRIDRLHQPGKTLSGVWSFESVSHSETLAEMLGKQGLLLEFDHWFSPDGPPAARLFGEEQGPSNYQNITDGGFIPQIAWLGPNAGAQDGGDFAQYGPTGERAGLWYADVAGGMWDEELRAMARKIAAVDAPLFWVPYEEFTGGWRPAIDLQHNPPEDFGPAWQRMWKLFQEEGATNAAFVVAPAHNIVDEGLEGDLGMETWWPGDEYVDYIGFDLYAASHKPEPASENIQAAIDLFNQVTDEPKPFLMNEIGVKPSYLETDADLSPAEWTREALQYMREENQVIGVNWWDFDGETGITQTQSWEESPSGLTDIGTAYAEEIEGENFVVEPDYAWQPMPDYDGLANRTPPTPSTAESKPVSYTVANTPVEVDGTLDDLAAAGIDLSGDTIVRSDGVSISGGTVWVTYDESALYLAAAVEDDVHTNQYQSSRNWDGDVFQLGVAGSVPTQTNSYAEFNMSLSDGEETIFANPTVPGDGSLGRVESSEASFRRDEAAGRTIYEVALPWSISQLPIDPSTGEFGLAFGIADKDGDGSWQWLSWTDCDDGAGIMAQKDPSCFFRVAFE